MSICGKHSLILVAISLTFAFSCKSGTQSNSKRLAGMSGAEASGVSEYSFVADAKVFELDESTIYVKGVGTSGERGKTPLQKMAIARESARIEAQQIILEHCMPRGLYGIPGCCSVVVNTLAPNPYTNRSEFVKRGKILKSECNEDSSAGQFGCIVVVKYTKTGLRKDCELARSGASLQY